MARAIATKVQRRMKRLLKIMLDEPYHRTIARWTWVYNQARKDPGSNTAPTDSKEVSTGQIRTAMYHLLDQGKVECYGAGKKRYRAITIQDRMRARKRRLEAEREKRFNANLKDLGIPARKSGKHLFMENEDLGRMVQYLIEHPDLPAKIWPAEEGEE